MNLLARRADVMELRARFYGPLSRKARIKLLLQGAAMGQYRNAKQGVRIHNALRDLSRLPLQSQENSTAYAARLTRHMKSKMHLSQKNLYE